MLNQNSNESSIPWDDPFWLDDEEEKPKFDETESNEEITNPDVVKIVSMLPVIEENTEIVETVSKEFEELNLKEKNECELQNQCDEEIRNDKSFQPQNGYENQPKQNGGHRSNKQRNNGQYNHNRNMKQNYSNNEHNEDRESICDAGNFSNNKKNNGNKNNTSSTKRQHRNGQYKDEHSRHISVMDKDLDFNLKIEIRREFSESNVNKSRAGNKNHRNVNSAQNEVIIEDNLCNNKIVCDILDSPNRNDPLGNENEPNQAVTESHGFITNQNDDDNSEVFFGENETENKPNTNKRPTKKIYNVNGVKGKWSNLFVESEGDTLKLSQQKLAEPRAISNDKALSKSNKIEEKVNNLNRNVNLNQQINKHDNLRNDMNVRSENSRKNNRNNKCRISSSESETIEKQNESYYPIYENNVRKMSSDTVNNEIISDTENKYYMSNINRHESEDYRRSHDSRSNNNRGHHNRHIEERGFQNEKVNSNDLNRQQPYENNDLIHPNGRKNLKSRETKNTKKNSNERNILNNDCRQGPNIRGNVIDENGFQQDKNKRTNLLDHEKSNTNHVIKETTIDSNDNWNREKKGNRLNNDYKGYNESTMLNNFKENQDNRKNVPHNGYRECQDKRDNSSQNLNRVSHDNRDNKNGPHDVYREYQDGRDNMQMNSNRGKHDNRDNRNGSHDVYREFQDSRDNMQQNSNRGKHDNRNGSHDVYREYQDSRNNMQQNSNRGKHDNRDNRNGSHDVYREYQDSRDNMQQKSNRGKHDNRDNRNVQHNMYRENQDARYDLSYNLNRGSHDNRDIKNGMYVYADYLNGRDIQTQNVNRGLYDNRDNTNESYNGYREYQDGKDNMSQNLNRRNHDNRDSLPYYDHRNCNGERENLQDSNKLSRERNEIVHKHKRNISSKENRASTKTENSGYGSDNTITNDSPRNLNIKKNVNDSNILHNNLYMEDPSELIWYSEGQDRKNNTRFIDDRKYQQRKDFETNHYTRKNSVEIANDVNTECVNTESRRNNERQGSIANTGRRNQNSKELSSHNSSRRFVEEKNNSERNYFNRNQIDKDELGNDGSLRKNNWGDKKQQNGNRKISNREKNPITNLEIPVEEISQVANKGAYNENRRNENYIYNQISDDRYHSYEKDDGSFRLNRKNDRELNGEKIHPSYKRNLHNDYNGFEERREITDSRSNFDKRNYGHNTYNGASLVDDLAQNGNSTNPRSINSHTNGYSKPENTYKPVSNNVENSISKQLNVDKRNPFNKNSGVTTSSHQLAGDEERKQTNDTSKRENSDTTQKSSKNNRGSGHRQRNQEKDENGTRQRNGVTKNQSKAPRYNFMSNNKNFEETNCRNIKDGANFTME